MNAGPNLSVVPNDDEITVKEHTSLVDEPVFPNTDVYALVATER